MSFSRMLGAAAAVSLLLLASPVLTAEITVLDLTAPNLNDEEVSGYRCHYRLSGPLENGDLAKLDSVAINGGLLCLDSPGGSYGEALRIIDYMQKQKMQGTRLEEGATCDSACAIIFMAGIHFSFEVGEFPWREMHRTARLGFHSPALVVPEGTYDASSVGKAYNVALASMADALGKLVLKRDFDGAVWMQPSLLGTMLATPPENLEHVDTIGEAGRWRIKVLPDLPSAGLDEESLKRFCRNILAWSRDDAAPAGPDTEGRLLVISRTPEERGEGETITITEEGMWVRGCKFGVPRGATSTDDYGIRVTPFSDVSDEPKMLAQNIHLLDPATPLTAIPAVSSPSAKPVSAPKSEPAPPSPGGSMTCTVSASGTVIDREPCTKIFREQSSTGAIVDYVWPSGGKTVVVMTMQGRQINGAQGVQVLPPAGQAGDCTMNMQTGKTFCADPG